MAGVQAEPYLAVGRFSHQRVELCLRLHVAAGVGVEDHSHALVRTARRQVSQRAACLSPRASRQRVCGGYPPRDVAPPPISRLGRHERIAARRLEEARQARAVLERRAAGIFGVERDREERAHQLQRPRVQLVT